MRLSKNAKIALMVAGGLGVLYLVSQATSAAAAAPVDDGSAGALPDYSGGNPFPNQDYSYVGNGGYDGSGNYQNPQ